jgi:hypothetical protein
MPTSINARRLPRAVALVGVLTLCGLAFVSTASAATVYACVKHNTGTARIVTSRTKCRHGERRLSWNSVGPAGSAGPGGATGSAGSEGKPGANGAVADYAASYNGAIPISPLKENVVLTKTIPPGSYLISAKTIAAAEGYGGVAQLNCGLTISVGKEQLPGMLAVDASAWIAPLEKLAGGEYAADSTLSMLTPFTLPVTTTLGLICGTFESSPGVTISVSYSVLSALQVSKIG